MTRLLAADADAGATWRRVGAELTPPPSWCFPLQMQWSPVDPLLVWWAPEKGDIPACVTLTKFPEKTVVRTKNLFHVKTCRVYWQASGDFLCVEVTRVSKSGKTEYTDFQLFRMQERNIPIEVRCLHACVRPHVQACASVCGTAGPCPSRRVPHQSLCASPAQILSYTTQIYNFAWEPVGTRFGIIHQGDGPGRYQTVFYDMGAPGSQHQLLCTSSVSRWRRGVGSFLARR